MKWCERPVRSLSKAFFAIEKHLHKLSSTDWIQLGVEQGSCGQTALIWQVVFTHEGKCLYQYRYYSEDENNNLRCGKIVQGQSMGEYLKDMPDVKGIHDPYLNGIWVLSDADNHVRQYPEAYFYYLP